MTALGSGSVCSSTWPLRTTDRRVGSTHMRERTACLETKNIASSSRPSNWLRTNGAVTATPRSPDLGPEIPLESALAGRHDVVVAMYHDQGLIPAKLVALEGAVNLTLGLPVVRTSPDHGTAFDIAGQGKADASSMKKAIELALDLIPVGTSL